MKVNVTKQNIEDGQRYSLECCPIALAIKDLGCENVRVFETQIYIERNGKNDVIFLPENAKSFITNFDGAKLLEHRNALKPFEFELNWNFT